MLELKNISWRVKGESGEIDIIKNVNLTLEENKVYVVTGPNGGGKSTLAKIIMGIVKPSSGQILLNGQDITDLSVTERANMDIGYAFQSPPIFKGINVRELILLAAKADDGDTFNPAPYLFDVGLCAADYLDREMDSGLSGGELKRIEIATILARNPKWALFDEPEAGIDLWSFKKLAETFERMNKSKKMTLLLISHQERIMQLADEIIVLANGEVQEITSKDKFLNELSKGDTCGVDCGCDEVCERCGE